MCEIPVAATAGSGGHSPLSVSARSWSACCGPHSTLVLSGLFFAPNWWGVGDQTSQTARPNHATSGGWRTKLVKQRDQTMPPVGGARPNWSNSETKPCNQWGWGTKPLKGWEHRKWRPCDYHASTMWKSCAGHMTTHPAGRGSGRSHVVTRELWST